MTRKKVFASKKAFDSWWYRYYDFDGFQGLMPQDRNASKHAYMSGFKEAAQRCMEILDDGGFDDDREYFIGRIKKEFDL